MSITERTDLPALAAGATGPYLCNVWEPLPTGWQRTLAAASTGTCLAYDPTRHTVVRNIDNQNQAHLAALVERAGFHNFQVPGTDTGFFARDRRTAPPPTMSRDHAGIGR